MGRLKSWLALVAGTIVVCAVLASPAAALSTHSVTVTEPSSSGYFVAKPECGPGEHVISGGYSVDPTGSAMTSRAVRHAWTVHAFTGSSGLTAYVYCSSSPRLARLSTEVTAESNTTPTNGTAQCDKGTTAFAGGFRFLDEATGYNSPIYESDQAGSRSWAVQMDFGSVPNSFDVYAYCGSAKIDVHTAQSDPIDSSGPGTATAECDPGEKLLSGGYATTPEPDFYNSSGPDFFYYESKRSGQRGWTASAVNFSNASGQIVVAAYCTS